MDMYWPQHKVFFIATLSLFSENISGKIITALFFAPYFARDDVVIIELTLEEYRKEGYLDYKKLSDNEFEVKDVNSFKATNDLEAYLKKWQDNKLLLLAAKQPADSSYHRSLLLDGLARSYRLNPQNQQRIMLDDIYISPSDDLFGTPFWESVLSLYFSKNSEAIIQRIGYDRSESGLYKNNAKPFVDLKVTSPQLLRSIELAARSSEPIRDEEPVEIEYNGLRFNRDESVSYKGILIELSPQETAVLRVLLARPEEWRSEDAFTDPSDDVFRSDASHANLSKVMSKVRLKLNAAIDHDQNIIMNKRSVGWRLKINPTE